MLVRVHFPRRTRTQNQNNHDLPWVSALGGLVTLIAVSCLMLGVWRLTWDLGWTSSFVISDGFWSHWQVWMAFTIAFSALAVRLVRYGRPRDVSGEDDQVLRASGDSAAQ